jgi:peptide-methionine (S)-S-oxide reductase
VGYVGGSKEDPTYKEVCTGNTGHSEAVEVVYDPKLLPTEDLLKFFFQIHDPTTKDRQQNDVGTQYRSGIFYTTAEQKKVADQVLKDVAANANFLKAFKNAPPVTEVTKAGTYYTAEDYHQKYLDVNPTGYW